MKKIVIFDDTPSSNGCGCFLGVIALLFLLVGGIAIWPIMIGTAGDDIKSFLTISGVVILSCIGTTIIYYVVNRKDMHERGFFRVFGVIYVVTAIATGIFLKIAFNLMGETDGSFHDDMTILFAALMVPSVPSAIATAVCKWLKNK